MKASQPWHSTPLGTAIRWLGSIQLAVPILTLVAGALAWGTYLESTQDAKVAKQVVYGSWWFVAIMGLVCVSLIFAALTRFPWKRRHVGFLVVHASLVALIAGGFWSMFGRVEGRVMLEQGSSSGMIETTEEQIEIVQHDAGKFRSVASIPVPRKPGTHTIAGVPVEVLEFWDNTKEEFEITDDGPDEYRALKIAFGPMEASAVWIGDEARGEAPEIDGVRVRVLAAGKDWAPPANPAAAAHTGEPAGYTFTLEGKKYPLTAEGQEVFPGWKIVSIKRFAQATVSAGGLSEGSDKQNPAVDVIISDGAGSSERHTAFEQFPDMIMSKSIEGSNRSRATLSSNRPAAGGGQTEETLVIYGQPPAMKVAYIARDGTVKQLEHDAQLPWVADFGARKFNILKQFTRAKENSKFIKAPAVGDEHRPALLIKVAGETTPLAWKGMLPVKLPDGGVGLLRFGPHTVGLPFEMRLDQFRKTDYPGTEMAMAYESDVTVAGGAQPDFKQTISMNNPLVRSGWKVYQSGFMGESISIFSVMKDPGLPLTYLSCTTLCIGILITFYGRGLTWGHPGIPTPFSAVKEQSNVPVAVGDDSVEPDPVVGPSGGQPPALDGPDGGAADPGRRAGDAAGYVRA